MTNLRTIFPGGGDMKPYYEDSAVKIYHGDCREIALQIQSDLIVSDPPFPYNGENFKDDIHVAVWFAQTFKAARWFWFWDLFDNPPIRLPIIAKHIWHKTNTNRPNNYEVIYECANDAISGSRVFPAAVIFEGLTGCAEATGHPTQKPLRLLKSLLRLRDSPSVILDPFMGSGTTLRAAKDLGRKAIGIEIEERYCEIAARRMAQEVFDFA
jgi:DNA modification methylase